MINKGRTLRLYMRLGCFLLAVLLLLPLPFWIGSSRLFVQTSSFVTICTVLAGGTFWVGSIAPGNAFPGTRREFIAIAAGLGFSLWAQQFGQARSKNAPLRPPGATKEHVFTGHACDAATAYASVHPTLFIPIRDNPEFLGACRPLSDMKRITAMKNAMPVRRYAPVELYRP